MKPENILLHISGVFPRLILGDFGHATTVELLKSVGPTEERFLSIGTVSYNPPERIAVVLGQEDEQLGDGQSDLAMMRFNNDNVGDMWSLGCKRVSHLALNTFSLGLGVLFFCITGSHPYDDRRHGDSAQIYRDNQEDNNDDPDGRSPGGQDGSNMPTQLRRLLFENRRIQKCINRFVVSPRSRCMIIETLLTYIKGGSG